MGEEKGKGPASDLQDVSHEDNQTSAEEPSQSSLFSRVKSSTAGLASNAFSVPSSDDLNKAGAALLGGSGKSAQTSSSSSAWAENSRSTGRIIGSKESEPTRFRNGLEDQHVQQMESEFSSFLDGVDPFMSSQDDTIQLEQEDAHNHGVDLLVPTQDHFLHNSMNTLQSESEYEHRPRTHLSVREQEILDGDEVLAILCSPSLMDENPRDYSEAEDLSQHLTPEQISKIRIIINGLFPPINSHIAPPADHPLNLRPDLDMSSARTVSQLPLGTNKNDLQAYFSQNNDSDEAKRTFIQQWEGVLAGYVDEVWGDLLPLVKEARQEIEIIKSGDAPSVQPKALRRLGLILSHIQN